jgi:hypothetical protein
MRPAVIAFTLLLLVGTDCWAGLIDGPVLIARRDFYYLFDFETGQEYTDAYLDLTTDPEANISANYFKDSRFPTGFAADAIAVYDISKVSLDTPAIMRLYILSAALDNSLDPFPVVSFGISPGPGSLDVTLADFPSEPYGSGTDIPAGDDVKFPYILDIDVTETIAQLQAANEQYMQVYFAVPQTDAYTGGIPSVGFVLSIPEPSSITMAFAPLALGLVAMHRRRSHTRTRKRSAA